MAEDRAYEAREVYREMYRDTYKNYSDDQLKIKRETAYQQTMTLTDPRDIRGAGQMLLAEMEVCNEILVGRAKVDEAILEKRAEWDAVLEKRREAAVLNLRASATPNGQLVLSILEDENRLDAQELHGWCDELSELPEEVFSQLLDDLVHDGFLERTQDGKYLLRTPCTKELQYDLPNAKKCWDRFSIVQLANFPDWEKTMKSIGHVILQLIADHGGPMSGFMCGYCAEKEGYPEADPVFLDSMRLMTSMQKGNIWMNTMKHLVDAGILMHAYPAKEFRRIEGSEYYQKFSLHLLDWFCDFAVVGYQEPEEKPEEEDDEE